MELPRHCLLSVRAVCFSSADSEICHTLHSDHKIMKEAVKIICDMTGSRTEVPVNVFLPARKIALNKSFKFNLRLA